MSRTITYQAANRVAALALALLDPPTGTPHPEVGKLLAEQILHELPASPEVLANHENLKGY